MIKPGFAFFFRFIGKLSPPLLNKITCTHVLEKNQSKEVGTLFRLAACGRTTEIRIVQTATLLFELERTA